MSIGTFNQTAFRLNLISPRNLAIILAIFFLLLAVLIYQPMSVIFSGQDWKLNQAITLGVIEPFGAINIRFYSICILFGVFSGFAMAVYLSRWHFIPATLIDRLFIGLVIFGLIGARAFYVIFNLDKFSNDYTAVLYIPQGGLAFFGMLIPGLFYVWTYCRRFKFNFFEFGDFLVPAVLLGQIFGRFGNFFNYEAYGGPTSVFWKMYVPEVASIWPDINQRYFHPTFLYEIIPNIFLLLTILFFYQKLTAKRAGLVMSLYLVGYGIIRTVTEFFRLDALKINLPQNLWYSNSFMEIKYIYASSVVAVALVVWGIYIFLTRKDVIYQKRTMMEYSK